MLTLLFAVEIPYRTIQEVVISNRPTSLFLTLWEPPRIFLHAHQSDEHVLATLTRNMSTGVSLNLPRPSQRERLSKIPHDNADHGEVIGQSLIYCITLSPVEFASKIERLRENEYLEFSLHDFPTPSVSYSYMADELASFKATVRELSQAIPFDILYQFQSLVQNGYLLPHTVQKLLIRLEKSKFYEAPKKIDDVGNSESRTLLPRYPFSAPAVKSKIVIKPIMC